jgi:hypothetical protein
MLKQIAVASLVIFAYLVPTGVTAGPTVVKPALLKKTTVKPTAATNVLKPATAAKPVIVKKTVGKPVLQAICLAFKVTPNQGRTVTTLKGGCSFAGATAVHFGAAAAAFTVQKDGSITATPPALPAGSSVPVTVTTAGGVIVGGRAELYSYPIAEMDMEGPYSFPLAENSQDAEDWWSNPNKDSHYLRESQPAALAYVTLGPTLYVSAYFSNTIYTESTQAPYVMGNIGLFTAKLQVCSASSPSNVPAGSDVVPHTPGNACTIWDNTPGYWYNVTSASATVHAPTGTETAAESTIALPTAPIFTGNSPASLQLAQTLRIVYDYKESDDDQLYANRISEARFDEKNGKPFTAIIEPTALYQMKAMPYTILYQPPGDQSTVSFIAQTTYGATYTLGTSTENDTNNTSEQNESTKFSETYTFGLFTGGFGDKSGWDQTTKQDFGATNGTTGVGTNTLTYGYGWNIPAAPALIPGSGAVCASTTNCSSQIPAANAYANEPFWLDTIVLLVHPQYAYWQLSAQDQRYVMYGAVPVTADADVVVLDACARGLKWQGLNACEFDYTDDGLTTSNGGPVSYSGTVQTLVLTPSEAINLLALDPFYAQGQNAYILPTRGTQIGSANYGASIGVPARAYTSSLANTMSTQLTASTNLQYTSSVTTVVSDDPSITGGGKGSNSDPGVGYDTSLAYDDETKSSEETVLKTTFSNSTAVSSQRVTTASVVLNDVDNTSTTCKTCHNPLAHRPTADIYFDRVFGTFMFPDRGAPSKIAFVKPVCCRVLLLGLLAQEAHLQRFSDVPKNDPNAAILGLMARAKLIPAVSAGKFAPKSPAGATLVSTALTRARAHVSALPAAALAIKPSAAMTREQAAVALFKSLTAGKP